MNDLLMNDTRTDLLIASAGLTFWANRLSAIAQQAIIRLRTVLGECLWDVTLGIPYGQDVLQKASPIVLQNQYVTYELSTIEGVDAVRGVSVEWIGQRAVRITCEVLISREWVNISVTQPGAV